MNLRIVLGLLFLAWPAAGQHQNQKPKVSSSRLNIEIPTVFHKAEGYNHSISLFGAPKNTGSIAEYVYYAASDLCEINYLNASCRGYPEREIDPTTGKMLPWQTPFILIVDRSEDCVFAHQVRTAQYAGASGVVIANTKCVCSDRVCPGNGPCEADTPVLADVGGSGRDITIPSFLMLKQDADKIKTVLIANQSVQMKLTWNLRRPIDLEDDGAVDYHLWTTPPHVTQKTFLKAFRPVVEVLGPRARFTPHILLGNGTALKCLDQVGNHERCYNLCTNNGRYCSYVPSSSSWWQQLGVNRISGYDMIKESLRRMCIWNQYGADSTSDFQSTLVWWDYISFFTDNCEGSGFFSNDTCIRYAYNLAKIDKALIDQCMEDSGGVDNDVPNVLLEGELESQKRFGVVTLPSLIVDNVVLDDGPVTPYALLALVCDRFTADTSPRVCLECVPDIFPMDCIQKIGDADSSDGHIHKA